MMNSEKIKFSLAVNKNGWIFHGSVPDGIVRSTDRGLTWPEKNDGILAQYLQGCVVNSKGDIFAVTQFALYRSTNENPGGLNPGDIWQEVTIEQLESNFDPILRGLPGDILYHGSFFGLYRSEDKGDHWVHVIEGDTITNDEHIFDLQIAPNDWIYACTNKKGLLVSKDNGKTWARVPNLPQTEIMTAIAFSGDTVLTISFEGACWRSANRGINWSRIDSFSEVSAVKSLIRHPDGSYIALMNSVAKRSTNAGVSWVTIFPDSIMAEQRSWNGAMYSLFLTSIGHVLIGTDTGIWRSLSPFDQWEQVAYGITALDYRRDHYCNVAQFAEDPNTGYIFAATRGQSMFRSIRRLLGVKLSSAVALTSGVNYPNPFREETQIQIATSEAGNAELEVFTTLGESVMRESKGHLVPGSYTFRFDGSGLSAGSYLYVLRVDGQPVARGWMQLTR
jgi:hypothetical protein